MNYRVGFEYNKFKKKVEIFGLPVNTGSTLKQHRGKYLQYIRIQAKNKHTAHTEF